MKFSLVTGRVFTCVCTSCKQLTRAGDRDSTDRPLPAGPTWADLDGKPFEAYYCEPCKRAAMEARHAVRIPNS